MRFPTTLLLLLAALILAGCNTGGSSFAFGSDCESRGYTPGTNAYNSCVRDTGGRDLIYSNRRKSNTGR